MIGCAGVCYGVRGVPSVICCKINGISMCSVVCVHECKDVLDASIEHMARDELVPNFVQPDANMKHKGPHVHAAEDDVTTGLRAEVVE